MTTPPMFPTLAGQGWSVHKKPTFASIVAGHVSGREVRDALYLNPIWNFELTFDGLDGAAAAEYGGLGAQSLQALMGLFLQCQGQFGAFLYVDPTDSAVTGQSVGAGDGATTNFVLSRTLGGFNEPVGWATNVTDVYLNGALIPAAGLAPPAAPSLSQVSAGALGAATYYAKVTYVTASGETAPSAEASLAVTANHVLSVASPATPSPASAIGWNVYVATASGAQSKQNAAPIALGTAWQETAPTGLISGAPAPASNTTGWSLVAPNILAFAGAPAATAAISADFAYAFVCRFDADDLDFEQFMSNLWRAQSVKFRSLRAQ
ncbi:MAG: DUF2460 domain-containing protein [Pseudomonadota bacterium]|nr:DUF2460 domain-containing protein [Pseudomonadota bacterium]